MHFDFIVSADLFEGRRGRSIRDGIRDGGNAVLSTYPSECAVYRCV